MWKALKLLLYLAAVEVFALYLVVFPVYAFQVSSSTTGWVRSVNAAGASSMFAANRAANISTIASAAASAAGTSLAIRMVTGLGWVGLGVSAGLLLYDMYYSSSELAAVKAAATHPAGWSLTPGYVYHGGEIILKPPVPPYNMSAGYDAVVNIPGTLGPGGGGCVLSNLGNLGAGWTGWFNNPQGDGGCANYHFTGQANAPVATPATTGTAAEIATTLQTLPAANPLSLESNTTPQGVSGTTVPADQVVTQSIPSTSVTSQVVPATSVGPTDVVVNKDATAPAGTAPTVTATQTTTGPSTTTTTTTTNGNTTTATTTTTDTDTAPVSSCSVGNHEPRTFGGILQTHLDTWKGSGLLSALNLLGTLVWPTTSPTYTLPSSFLGTFTFDFTAWAGMFLAIRSVIIAIAGFVAYKIIFVGGRA